MAVKENERDVINKLQNKARALIDATDDNKIKTTVKLIKNWLKTGDEPIIFCHYICI